MEKPPENKMIDYSNIENKAEPMSIKDVAQMMDDEIDKDKLFEGFKEHNKILNKHLAENKPL